MKQKIRLLDGSMSSQLKMFGYNTEEHTPHWTFPANADDDLMRKVYSSFLSLGVDIITTNTYHFGSTLDESTEDGSNSKYIEYFKNTCNILCNQVNEHQNKAEIWGSIGTFATFYHDMSEYNGKYIDLQKSYEKCLWYYETIINLFHTETKIEKLLFETVPTEKEALAIQEALKKFPGMKAVVSFTCKENGLLRHGEPISNIAKILSENSQIMGIGINCTDPENVLAALLEISKYKFTHVFVYPNFGDTKFLSPLNDDNDDLFNLNIITNWVKNGATAIGGCCGVSDKQMRHLRVLVDKYNSS